MPRSRATTASTGGLGWCAFAALVVVGVVGCRPGVRDSGTSAGSGSGAAVQGVQEGGTSASTASGAGAPQTEGSGDRSRGPAAVVCGARTCVEGAECVTGTQGPECRCRSGFTQHSPESRCVDIDECQIENICPNATCENKEGSYICTCKAGYVPGANSRCDDIDECAAGTHRCDPAKPCENTKGGYMCGGVAVEPDGADVPTAPVPGWILAISEGSAAGVGDGPGDDALGGAGNGSGGGR